MEITENSKTLKFDANGLIPAIVLVLTQMKRQDRAKKIGAGLCIAALVCFAWFYPVLSGLPVPTLWAQSTKILPSYGFY